MGKINDYQYRILECCLPTGIIKRRYLYGIDKQETRRLRDAFSQLEAMGALREHVVGHDTKTGRDHKRHYLTQYGWQLLFSNLPTNHLLGNLELDSVNIRYGLNADCLSRLVRTADTMTILSSVGVHNAYTAALTKVDTIRCLSRNLDLLASTHFSGSTLYDIIMRQVITDNLANNYSVCVSPFFVAQSCIMSSTKRYNNSLGYIVNITAHDCFTVYKSLDKDRYYWRPRSYTCSCFDELRRLGVIAFPYSAPKSALILFDNESSIINWADHLQSTNAIQYADPYDHVFPVLLRDSGIDLLRRLVHNGTEACYHQEARHIQQYIPSLTPHTSQFWTAVDDQKQTYIIATIIDYALIATEYKRSACSRHIWVCYPDQLKFYVKLIDVTRLIVIPRP